LPKAKSRRKMMGSRNLPGKNEKKKKKDDKAKAPVTTEPAFSATVEVIKKKRKESWPED
jgi:hypothetical protein